MPSNRRSFIKTAGAAILGTGLAANAQARSTAEIATVVSGDDVVRTKTVPQRWQSWSQRTKESLARARNEHGNNRGVVGFSRTQGDKEYDGLPRTNLEVQVNPATYDDNVPSEVRGVPVREIERRKPVPTCYNDGDFTTIPGGV